MREYKDKPSYLCFLKYRVKNQNNICLDPDKTDRYIESASTKSITFLLYFIYIMFMAILSQINWLSKLNILYKIFIVIFGLVLYSFILETIHWFYVKFEKIE